MTTALELRDIHHDFSGLQVLIGIDLAVDQGERHAIIGPNGAGKSTLFNIISGRLRPRQGRVLYHAARHHGMAAPSHRSPGRGPLIPDHQHVSAPDGVPERAKRGGVQTGHAARRLAPARPPGGCRAGNRRDTGVARPGRPASHAGQRALLWRAARTRDRPHGRGATGADPARRAHRRAQRGGDTQGHRPHPPRQRGQDAW